MLTTATVYHFDFMTPQTDESRAETGKPARYITNGTYVDYWFCPDCDGEVPILPGQDIADCPDCNTKWQICFDYSFDEGHWRNCSTMKKIEPRSGVNARQTPLDTQEQQ